MEKVEEEKEIVVGISVCKRFCIFWKEIKGWRYIGAEMLRYRVVEFRDMYTSAHLHTSTPPHTQPPQN